MRDKSKSLVKEKSLRSFLLRLSPTFVIKSVLSTLVPCFSGVDLITDFRVYMYIQDIRLTTDATGQQEMFTSPRHPTPSLVFPRVCVCSVLKFWVSSRSEMTPCYHVHRISCQSHLKHPQNQLHMVRVYQCLFKRTTFQILFLCT